METNLLENDIIATIGVQKYYVEVNWRNGVLVMDEPTKIQGGDLGPVIHTLLCWPH